MSDQTDDETCDHCGAWCDGNHCECDEATCEDKARVLAQVEQQAREADGG